MVDDPIEDASFRSMRDMLALTLVVFIGTCVPLCAFSDDARPNTKHAMQGAVESPVSEAAMKHALQQYLDGFNQGNAELLISLFAENATIEDPVGGGRIVTGKAAITEFYRWAIGLVERLELDVPIRGSHGRSAAMAPAMFSSSPGGRSFRTFWISLG